MLLKPRIIVENYRYTRITRYGKLGMCYKCNYYPNYYSTTKNDCRYIRLKRGTTLITYCTNDSIISEFRQRGSNWIYVITEER